MSEFFKGLPPTIRIGPFDVKVSVKKALEGGAWGLYTHAIEIELCSEHPDKLNAADTVLHECLHGVFRCAGWTRKEEEKVVGIVAPGLIQLFRANPKLLKWLVASMKR